METENKGQTGLIITLQIIVIILAIGAGYLLYKYRATPPPPASAPEQIINQTGIQNPAPVNSSTTPEFQIVSYNTTVAAGQITWQPAPQLVRPLPIFYQTEQRMEDKHEYYLAGTVTDPASPLAGANVILLREYWEGMGEGYSIYHLLQTKDGKNIFLNKYNTNPGETVTSTQPILYDANNLAVNYDLKIAELEVPKTLTNAKDAKQTLILQSAAYELKSQLEKSLWLKIKPVFVSTDGRQVYLNDENTFVTINPDQTVNNYLYSPTILNKGFPLLKWNDGTVATGTYNFTDQGGCGASNVLSVVDSKNFNLDRDYVKAGVSNSGDPIYEIKNSNDQRLKDFYDRYKARGYYESIKEKQMSYKEFVKAHVMFFWTDPFGRFVKFENANMQPFAECGKPVIYLYPKQKTDVSVELTPVGGFSYTEPAYNNGWRVSAEPTGTLTEISSGRTYPYLFWEGRGGLYSSPTNGWVVARADVHNFLNTTLAKLGLNKKETADFEEFWEPRMQAAPYYFIGFHGNHMMNELAPLKVTPAPDSLIRILMDFKPLAKPITVTAPKIRTPIRDGFTVVEWGGVLR